MREIKFRYRIKEIKTNKTITQFFSLELVELGILNNKNKDTFVILSRDQYINLKDKNGKEIYEGDILKNINLVNWQENLIKVEYKENTYPESEGYDPYYMTIFGYDFKNNFCIDGKFNELEVIGNIFENPELITNSKF